MTALPQDFADMIDALDSTGVRYVVVGAFAMANAGYLRQTGDIDIFIEPTHENSIRLFAAIRAFGGPLHGADEGYFSVPGNFMQMGLPPLRIDLITSISGVDFEEAHSTSSVTDVGGRQVRFLGLDALIKNKSAAGRPKDVADAEELARLRAKKDTPP